MKRRHGEALGIIVKRWWVIVFITMLATFALSLYMGLGQSVWFDEGYSILLAKHSFADLITLTNVDAHPPLYYLLLKVWAGMFGWSELALRSLSAAAAAGAVGAVALLVRRLFSVRVMLAVLPFVAAAPFLLRYGYEIRMYALASLIGVLATYVLVSATRAESKRRYWWVAYGVLVAAGMYTLYMTMVVWLAHAVWLFVRTKPKKQLLRQPFVMGYVVALVLFLPQLPVFIQQTLHSALPGVGSELTLTKLVSVLGMLTVYTPEWRLGGWLSLLLIAGMILFGVLYAGVVKTKRNRQGLLLLSTLVVVPLVFYALTSLPPRQPIFIERYMAHVAVYSYLLIGLVAVLGMASARRKLALVFTATVLLATSIGLVRLQSAGNFNLERMQLPETRQIRAAVPCGTDTTVVADDPYTYIDSVYYFGDCSLVFYSKNPIDFRGGYAPLHGSDRRISTPSEVTTKRLVHLHWDGAEASFVPDASYHQVSAQTYDKQVVTMYER